MTHFQYGACRATAAIRLFEFLLSKEKTTKPADQVLTGIFYKRQILFSILTTESI